MDRMIKHAAPATKLENQGTQRQYLHSPDRAELIIQVMFFVS
jgi:hypothetical protein